MTVEAATYISQLNSSLPAGSDSPSELDDHGRLIKSVLKAQFPNFTAAACTPSVTELNYVTGVTSSIQTQLNNAARSWTVVSANATAAANSWNAVRTNGTAITLTLPASPGANTYVGVMDADNNAATVNIIVARNASTICGSATDLTVDVNNAAFVLVYINGSWRIGV